MQSETSSSNKVTHTPRIVSIKKDVMETSTIKSIFFNDEPSSKTKPGQFLMIWIPGLDEIPMSVSYAFEDGSAAISVKMIGPATNNLYSRKTGQSIGVRGPYGRGFNLTGYRRALLVAGGTGGAPLGLLSDLLVKNNRDFTVIIGANVANELLFLDRHRINTQRVGGKTIPVTEDGTFGMKGLASEAAEVELKENSYDIIYTCGPEPMIKAILDLGLERSIPVQASLERVIKCGIGICGSCIIDTHRVCKEGPVFDGEILKDLKEFNRIRRDHSGRQIPV